MQSWRRGGGGSRRKVSITWRREMNMNRPLFGPWGFCRWQTLALIIDVYRVQSIRPARLPVAKPMQSFVSWKMKKCNEKMHRFPSLFPRSVYYKVKLIYQRAEWKIPNKLADITPIVLGCSSLIRNRIQWDDTIIHSYFFLSLVSNWSQARISFCLFENAAAKCCF